MTDPPTTGSAVERQEPSQPLAEAVRDLYSTCHLPVPTVVVAPCASEFVRIVLALSRDWWLASSVWLILLFNAFAVVLAFIILRDVLEEGLTRSTRISLMVVALVSFTVIAVTRYPMGRHRSAPIVASLATLAFVGPTMLAGGLGFAFGGRTLGAAATVLGCAAVVLVNLALALTAPVRKRWAVRRAYRVPIPLRGARPLHDVFGARLRAAQEELPEASTMARRQDSAPARRERPEVVARLEAEGLRLDHIGWHPLRPLLGAGPGRRRRFLCSMLSGGFMTLMTFPTCSARLGWSTV